jgi:hypothetical protein
LGNGNKGGFDYREAVEFYGYIYKTEHPTKNSISRYAMYSVSLSIPIAYIF